MDYIITAAMNAAAAIDDYLWEKAHPYMNFDLLNWWIRR